MAGLYIHIPFCKSRCIYCGFYSTTAFELRQQYTDALCREIADRASGSISTIYLGGGTPSQLTLPQLHQIFDTIYKYNKVEKDAEVTIEVNPDDVTEELAAALPALSVNRVSMGAQTFDDERLAFLHRRHTSRQVGEAIDRLRKAGISNISIDLMYGFPEENLTSWQQDISTALSLDVEHLSAYCLMIEEGTPLYRMQISPIDEELERTMYELLMDRLEAAGYEHYEISNWSLSPRPLQRERESRSYRSRHNSSYWNQTPYIGIGAAAHSYDGQCCRRWNISDIRRYIDGIRQGTCVYEEEWLDEDTRYNDCVTVALRTCEGINLKNLSARHRQYCLENAQHFIDDGLLKLSHDNHQLSITRRGLFISDMIMSDLMLV
ncbi:MAG: radical SAM family heme chaperone HemW [Prevotella sp.]|nr:radical SAM family heme chaperone HemW [Prevotella sp.]